MLLQSAAGALSVREDSGGWEAPSGRRKEQGVAAPAASRETPFCAKGAWAWVQFAVGWQLGNPPYPLVF